MSVRRRRPDSPPIPERLARFVRSEWPPHLSCEQAVEVWAAEREVWAQDNGYEWFGYTMSPIGDVIDRHVAKREAWLMNCTVRDAAESNGHG